MAAKVPMNAEIKEIASAICEKHELTSWSQKAHVGLILSLAKKCGMDAVQLKQFAGYLEHKGVGGNASQFAHALAEEGIIAKQERSVGLAAEFIV